MGMLGACERPMTDAEIIEFCGLKAEPAEFQERFLRTLTPAKRELMDKMKQIEMWDASDGLIPLPSGVLLCR